MNKRVTSSFFINNLNTLRLRQPHSTAIRFVPLVTAALVTDCALSATREQLLKYVALGERAHGFRDADALFRIGQGILELPLGAKASSIGYYYTALSINRRGPQAYSEANRLLALAADGGYPAFRAKAMIALGTNLNISGDRSAAVSTFREARGLAEKSGFAGVQAGCVLEMQDAFFHNMDGDHVAALAILRRLGPLVFSIQREYPALLHFYFNNLADELIKTGQVREALSLYPTLATSPFIDAYPEWRNTCGELNSFTHRASKVVICLSPSPSRANVSPFFLRTAPKELSKLDRFKARFWPKPRKGRLLQFESQQERKDRYERFQRARELMRPTITEEEASYMTYSQKQAFALRYVLSDQITVAELNEIINVALRHPLEKEADKQPEA